MTLCYPIARLVPDALRALFGVGITTGIAFQLQPDSVIFWLMLALGAVFTIFGGLTALRAATRIEVTEHSASAAPGTRRVRFDALRDLRLDYYSTRRDREAGWMQLTLRDTNGGRLKVDSRLEQFAELAGRASQAASRNGLHMDASTIENLRALELPDMRQD